jgi:pyridoxal phosphate enzyme (YggS family)
MKDRIDRIRSRIDEAVIDSGRKPGSVRLVAASKAISDEQLRLAIDAGVDIFGENYVQEAIQKIESLKGVPIHWHFIGHLQSKKAKYAVRHFDLIHTVDTIKVAFALNQEAKKINKIQDILIQVNVSGESTKSGVSIDDVFFLMKGVSSLENICVKGLMTMPPYSDDPEKSRPFFKALAELKLSIDKQSIPHIVMDELSMGMTDDFETAIAEGATLVRIGTAIFGERR